MQIPIKQDSNGEYFFELPDEIVESLQWKEGDTIVWKVEEGSSYAVLSKEDK